MIIILLYFFSYTRESAIIAIFILIAVQDSTAFYFFSLLSRLIFLQNKNTAVSTAVRTGQVLDDYSIFHRRHVVSHDIIFQPSGKGYTHLYLIFHSVGEGLPRLIA